MILLRVFFFSLSLFLAGRLVAANLISASEATPPAPLIECRGAEHSLLLGDVLLWNVQWRTGNGQQGCGFSIPGRRDSGHFWFFGAENIELTCKALDGTSLTGHYWIFCGALTDVEWWLEAVNNPNPSIRRQYYSPPSRMASFGDTNALQRGPNRSAAISLGNGVTCGSTHLVATNALGVVTIVTNDLDLDLLDITVEYNGSGVTNVSPQWNNPVSGAGTQIELWFNTALNLSEASITIITTDGTMLEPSRCSLKLLVVPVR